MVILEQSICEIHYVVVLYIKGKTTIDTIDYIKIGNLRIVLIALSEISVF